MPVYNVMHNFSKFVSVHGQAGHKTKWKKKKKEKILSDINFEQ